MIVDFLDGASNWKFGVIGVERVVCQSRHLFITDLLNNEYLLKFSDVARIQSKAGCSSFRMEIKLDMKDDKIEALHLNMGRAGFRTLVKQL